MTETSLLTELAGVGAARAKTLEKLGLATVRDLLGYFPRSYEDRTREETIAAAPLDEACCVRVICADAPHYACTRRGLEIIHVKVFDDTAALMVTFFNQHYVASGLKKGEEYVFFGRITLSREGARQMVSPQFEPANAQKITGRIVPVYPLTAGITSSYLMGLLARVLDDCPISETLPADFMAAHQLSPAAVAYEEIHRPETFEQRDEARRRFIFEELLCLALGLAQLKKRRCGVAGPQILPQSFAPFLKLLPYQLTGAQARVLEEARGDLTAGRPMNRLVQGDVGSGKTVIAAACAYLARQSGWQTAMMAPTEILAQQHFRTLAPLLAGAGMRAALLTAAMPPAEKKATLAGLKSGEIDFAIGTHALLSEQVAFSKLGLVITDEQHRFGVGQRARLAEKGTHPHVLVLSATPIPRTLALMIYGDLDVSILDELPPGRKEIETLLVGERLRGRLMDFVRKQVAAGQQVYIVCPAVMEGAEDLKAAEQFYAHLQREVLPDLHMGLIHGKLRPKEKLAAMAAFVGGEIDVLVATTVIEVGVDVPNACLMIIENAERYGLSQLHQLRGRVGRGTAQSWCVMVTESRNALTLERLKTMTETSDGFVIAEKDLALRGPGDFFGARQHGLPALRVADLNTDVRLMAEAQSAAAELIARDENLELPQHMPLRARVKRLFAENPEFFN